MQFTKTINVEEIPIFTKLEVALHQLERAISLFLNDSDYICAITLAGASEEILGKLLEVEGKVPALKSFVDTCVAVAESIYDEPFNPKSFVTLATSTRNDLKHITHGRPITVLREAAIDIINRAIDNYWDLAKGETVAMAKFRAAT